MNIFYENIILAQSLNGTTKKLRLKKLTAQSSKLIILQIWKIIQSGIGEGLRN